MKISRTITYITEQEADIIKHVPIEGDSAERIKKRTMQLAGLNRKKHRLRIVCVCAAVVSLLACSVFAVETTGLDYRLAGLFSNSEHMDMGSAVQNLTESTSKDSIKITAVQATGDKHCAYVMYRIDIANSAEQGLQSTDIKNLYFGNIYIQGGNTGLGGWHPRYIYDNGEMYTVIYMNFGRDKVNKGEYTFIFKDLCDAANKTVISGEWSISVKLDYDPVSRKIYSGKTIKTEDGRCRLKGIEISPVSIKADFTRGSNIDLEDIEIEAVTLKSKDNIAGACISSGRGSGIFGRVYSMEFGRIVNIDDVQSVTINGQIIKL